ncbi:BMC domain-containing protein [Desulfosporosinus sp. OT]|uniref:BMC domain-containing protein n=1 Tax=Desulfosporosinus sp. OT TaxID=913865 RepID=UPI0002239DB6|nr:BMC domain-containing protein [Desulfosporosinus sp. OT]EGW35907.1 BMC domain protein [Desulfosporosinus sp. OT]
MVGKALGLIETVGLVAALEAADAALKAANIEFMGYELTNGGGMVLVRFSGNVGAIKMAVEAGSLAAGKVSKVVATHVIPRPHQQLSCVLTAKVQEIPKEKAQVVTEMETDLQLGAVAAEYVIDRQPVTNIEAEIPEEPEGPLLPSQELQEEMEKDLASIELDSGNNEFSVVAIGAQQVKTPAELCNFCHDPACHRKKGDPKVNCIHYGKNNEEAE